jgi:hypothetical protein
MDVSNQTEIDQKMIELDGTDNKGKLGANGILAVSMAACRVSHTPLSLNAWPTLGQAILESMLDSLSIVAVYCWLTSLKLTPGPCCTPANQFMNCCRPASQPGQPVPFVRVGCWSVEWLLRPHKKLIYAQTAETAAPCPVWSMQAGLLSYVKLSIDISIERSCSTSPRWCCCCCCRCRCCCCCCCCCCLLRAAVWCG